MAQRPTNDFDIDPNITSGTDLANILNRFQDAIDSGNSGASRPAYLAAGGMWVKEGDPMRLYLYDGSKDIELYNTTDGIVGAIQDGTVDGEVLVWSSTDAEWMPNQSLIVKGGNVGIKTYDPYCKVDVQSGPSDWTDTANAQLALRNTNPNRATYIFFDQQGDLTFYNTGGTGATGANTIFRNPFGESMRIDASGSVGIGGTPSRSADEIAKEAKDTLAGWKSSFDANLKEEPKADKKAVTLEITGGEFDTLPAEPTLVERLTERNIDGGDALLQVAGDGYVSGTVNANQFVDANGPIVSAFTMTEAFRKIKNAVSDETTVEGIKESLTNVLGGLIEEFEAIGTQES